ncbi:MAG: hypothetical protein ABW187_03455 [Dokdonella sp.]
MQPYANRSGKSGVVAFDCGDGFIVVEFVAKDGEAGQRYRYTVKSAGAAAIAAMQRLAKAGRGLSTYIAQNDPNYD